MKSPSQQARSSRRGGPALILSRFSHEIGGLGRAALRSGRNGLLFTGTSSTSESDSMETTGETVGVCSTAPEFGTKAAEDAPAEVRYDAAHHEEFEPA
eukprot:scaffold4364_cov119-Isochrysis_galbana.AAC.19